MKALTAKLEKKIDDQLVDFDSSEKDFHVWEIFKAAALYWVDLDEDDFCLQSASSETLVFGGTNRLIWSAARGFQPDQSYCTEKFLLNWQAIGPLPGLSA